MNDARVFRFTFALALAWVAAACAPAECDTVQACDIRKASCQRETLAVLSCLRGGSGALPDDEVVEAASFIAEQVDDAESEPLPEDEAALYAGLALFRLMSPDFEPGAVEREYWDQVAAFFSSETERVTILDRGEALDEPESVTLLVHELVHALQAQESASDCCASYDEFLAARGLVEGEAELYQDLATVFGYGDDPEALDWDEIFQRFESWAWVNARANDNPYLFAPLQFPYAFGGDFVNEAYRVGGNAAVRALASEPPRTTRQVLSGYGARPPEGLWQENPEEVGTPELSAEYELVTTLRLGTFLFEIFEYKWQAGVFADSGFAGDVFNVFRHTGSGALVGAWRLRFESEARAAVVAERLAVYEELLTSKDGRDLALWASSDESALAGFGGVAWGPTPAPEGDGGGDSDSALPEMPHCPHAKRLF
jgi:hypothetical protein